MEGVSSVGERKKRLPGIVAWALCLGMMAMAAPAATLGAAQASSTSLPTRISPKAQKLLNHVIQALGGQAFLNFKSRSTTGRIFAFSGGRMARVDPFKSTYQPPDKRRLSYGKGKPTILVNNGDQAWENGQYGLVHQLPGLVREWKIANHYGLVNLFRSVIKEKGVLILDHGVNFVANRPVDVIDIFTPENVRVRLDIRKNSYLPLRVSFRLENPETRDSDDYVVEYDNYQSFSGIKTPMNIVRQRNGERISATYRNKVTYNQPVPANYFQPPR